MMFAAPSARYVNRRSSESSGTDERSAGGGTEAGEVAPVGVSGGEVNAVEDMFADDEEDAEAVPLWRMFFVIQGLALGMRGIKRAERARTSNETTIMEE